MSIPPVWPLFRPFTHRFIKSTVSRSQPRDYKQTYGPATPASPSFPPPLITTTISVSSTKDGGTTVVPSESSSRGSADQTPHSVLGDKKSAQGAWMEMKEIDPRRSP